MRYADDSGTRRRAHQLGVPLSDLILRVLRDRAGDGPPPCILAVCPTSSAVIEGAVAAARDSESPLFFAATLNQVDLDGGYTGWTPSQLVERLRIAAGRARYFGPIVVGLDHGGPWLKDTHAQAGWDLKRAIKAVRPSLSACVAAGYDLIHIDATMGPELGERPEMHETISRTVDLIRSVESSRHRLGLAPIGYEVGVEQIRGRTTDPRYLRSFATRLRGRLRAARLSGVWPCFLVVDVGTDLKTTRFDADGARILSDTAASLGCRLKGHDTDDVATPRAYPESGMGGANVGPEFAEVEYEALRRLVRREGQLTSAGNVLEPSNLLDILESAVVGSGRWRKWLLPDEQGLSFHELPPSRQAWLIRTGCRYVWHQQDVQRARATLYRNLQGHGEDPTLQVADALRVAVMRYLDAFRLCGTLSTIERALATADAATLNRNSRA